MKEITPEFLKLLDKACPFKRIKAPQHALDERSNRSKMTVEEAIKRPKKEYPQTLNYLSKL